MKKSLTILLLLFSLGAFADGINPDSSFGKKDKDIHVAACPNFGAKGFGRISIGLRGGACTLFDPFPATGFGYGYDLRYRFARRWNAELFADYFYTNILGYGWRNTKRIGINILYYLTPAPFRNHHFTYFIFGGITYDYHDVFSHWEYWNRWKGWGPTFDPGYGIHYNILPRLDVTFEICYVVPLTIHPQTSLQTYSASQYLHIEERDNFLGGFIGIIGVNFLFGHND